MSRIHFNTETREKFDTLMYRFIAFFYAVLVLASFSAALTFLYTAINAPFSLTTEDIEAHSIRVNQDDLQRVLKKLGIREAVME